MALKNLKIAALVLMTISLSKGRTPFIVHLSIQLIFPSSKD
jgi:hypothetical protein